MRIRLLLLMTVLAAPAGAATGGDEALSVALPASRPGPDELSGAGARRLSKSFDRALEALDDARWADAATGFDAVLAEVDWPEAAFNAALARYQLLDLAAARGHAAAAAEGLDDGPSHWLHAVVLGAVGRNLDARAAAERAAQWARDQEDAPLLVRSLLQQASASRLAGRYADARTAAEEARAAAVALGDPLLVAASGLAVGHAAAAAGDPDGAARAFAEAGSATTSAPGAQHELALADAESAWRAGRSGDARALLAAALFGIDADPAVPPLTRAGLLSRAAPLAFSLGDVAGAQARLAAADDVLRPAGALAAIADIDTLRASWAIAAGDVERGAALLRSAVATLEQVQAPMALAAAQLARAQVIAEQGQIREALRLAEASRDTFEAAGNLDGLPGAWLVLAELKGRGGALADAHAAGLRAVELATNRGNPRQEAAARAEVAVILARLGAVDEAAQAHAAAVSADGLLSVRTRVRLEVELARGFAHADRPTDGLRHAQAALAQAGSAEAAPADLVASAEEAVVAVLLEAGRHDEAEAFVAERGIQDERILAAVADRHGTARYNQGVDAYAEGDYQAAITHFRAVADAPESSDARRERARRAIQRSHEASGVAHLEVGAVKQAETDLAAAATLATELGDAAAAAQANLLRAQIAVEAGRLEKGASLAASAAKAAVAGSQVRAEAFELLGLAQIDADPSAARRAFEDALLSWGTTPESVARRATLTYNLAVLEQTGDPAALRARLQEAAALAAEAGDEDLRAEVAEWLEGLETP